MTYPYLPWSLIERALPLAAAQRVSPTARSARGFVPAYRQAGEATALSQDWQRKRGAFVARHVAQLQARGEPLYAERGPRAGQPTRRHLALIMWAYSPDPHARVRASIKGEEGAGAQWVRVLRRLGYRGETLEELAHEAGLPPDLLVEATRNSAVPSNRLGRAAAFLCGFSWGSAPQTLIARRYGWTPGARARYSL